MVPLTSGSQHLRGHKVVAVLKLKSYFLFKISLNSVAIAPTVCQAYNKRHCY